MPTIDLKITRLEKLLGKKLNLKQLEFDLQWIGLAIDRTDEDAGTIKIGKLNIDNNPRTARSYGVDSIPTLMIFKSGEVVDRFVGLQPKGRLQDAIDQAVS